MIALALAASAPASAASPPSGGTGSGNCPASNPANTLSLVAGTPQTAQLDAAFGAPLQVALANTDGCPVTAAVAGTPITFTAPASGASVVFASSGSNTLTVGSDSSGNAAAQMLSANDTPGSYTVTASSTYGTVSFALTNTAAGLPARVIALPPRTRSAEVGDTYGAPLAVQVLDASGVPVVGTSVTFSLGPGSGSDSSPGTDSALGSAAASAGASFAGGGSQDTVTTDSDGIATSSSITANATAGTFTATASAPHVSDPASFTLENLAGRAPSLSVVGPTRRSATVETRYGRRLRVDVRGANGSPVAGATVSFTLGSGGTAGAGSSAGAGASFAGGGTQASATTGPEGIATSPRLTANGTAGTFHATASLSGSSASLRFTLRNRAGRPATVTAGAAASESADTGARFAIRLAVTVTDAEHNPVPDVPVTFSAPASGASGTFARSGRPRRVTVRTDAHGVAVAPAFTANGVVGGYLVMARVPHARAPFALVNE
ncbi:MAG TPA: hypothetical protein VHX88_14445 [Solirubrobacteraceae bacterium]|nr:hypothetical protein [Solirubrobacteraceae bacterium]